MKKVYSEEYLKGLARYWSDKYSHLTDSANNVMERVLWDVSEEIPEGREVDFISIFYYYSPEEILLGEDALNYLMELGIYNYVDAIELGGARTAKEIADYYLITELVMLLASFEEEFGVDKESSLLRAFNEEFYSGRKSK